MLELSEPIVCRAIIYDETYNVLLARRARGIGKGLWALVGGKSDPGEPLDTAVVREVAEELNLKFDPTFYKDERNSLYDPAGRTWLVRYYHGKAIGSILLQAENSEARYFSEQALDDLEIGFGHKEII